MIDFQQITVWVESDDEEPGFSSLILELPGCASCGETVADAQINVIEALGALLESYRDDGVAVPWVDVKVTTGK